MNRKMKTENYENIFNIFKPSDSEEFIEVFDVVRDDGTVEIQEVNYYYGETPFTLVTILPNGLIGFNRWKLPRLEYLKKHKVVIDNLPTQLKNK